MNHDLSDLPDEVAELIAPHVAASADTLSAIGVAIAKKRDEAKAARTSSGIETTWRECEEAYIGIDDANRAEFSDARWAKPMSMDGPVTTGKTPQQTEHKSTAFVRLTARYVDAGSAKLAEILLPADDKAFSFSETPIPELIKAKEDKSHVVHSELGVPLMRPAKPGEAVPGATPAPTAAPIPGGAVPVAGAAGAPPIPGAPTAAPGAAPAMPGMPAAPAPPPQVPLTVADLAEENIEIARKSAKAAETRIYDWMVECQHTAEMRKVIDDSARIGVGVLKGPIPATKKHIAVEKGPNGVEVIIKMVTKPITKWCDPWNIFPDPACGENIHHGDYILELDFLSNLQVTDLKKEDGYIDAQIDLVLKEGPDGKKTQNDTTAGGSPDPKNKKGRFEIWYYYGSMKREDLGTVWAAAGRKLTEADVPPDKKEVYAIVTMINDHVVRATINPLDSGSFPYHSVPWSRRAGHWAGIGVGEQCRMPQKLVNQATRAMINNAGKSSGSQIVLDRSSIQPADGKWGLTPDKIWLKTGDTMGTVGDAFAMHEIPNVTTQLMTVINYGMQVAEESTSIPLITQGQSGPTQPETLGATNIQNNNANQLLRSIGYAFDDHITEPVVRQFYEYLLIDPEVPDEEKGEFTINAHGSVALVEQAIQDQTIAQLGQTVLNPVFGIDPKKWVKMFLKSKRLDPAALQYTKEEQDKIDAAPPPEAPAITVAKITAQTAATELAAKQTTDQQSAASEERLAQAASILDGQKVETEKARVEAENNRTVVTHIEHLRELEARERLAMLDYANRHQISLTQAKAELAKTAMTIDAQKELNAVNTAADLHKHHNPPPIMKPPAQAPGRAADGHAFDQAEAT